MPLPPYLDMDEEENGAQDGPAPAASIAGPQTPRDQVMQRISQVRQGSGNDDQAKADNREMAAMEFAGRNALNAGIGRGLNAIAAGTGAKVDNSMYDAMDKQGSDMTNHAMARSDSVRKAILDKKRWGAEFGERKRHNLALEGKGLNKNHDIDQLPEEDQVQVKTLAKKNADKIGIANQIESVMSGWDSLSDDQKVAQGRQLIKVLNSTEGADAVGAEEAKRLGGKLEFAMGNLFNSNPIQFGRDLPGFKEQASGTAEAIRSAIRANQMASNNLYRNQGIDRTDPPEVRRGAGRTPQPDGNGIIPDAKAGSGRVRVSNGTETLSIELGDLPDAMKDGFQVVK